jgi:hypothetical protein
MCFLLFPKLHLPEKITWPAGPKKDYTMPYRSMSEIYFAFVQAKLFEWISRWQETRLLRCAR